MTIALYLITISHNALDMRGSYDDTMLLDIATFIDEHNILPNQFGLSQNYPNPFNPATTIEYSLPGRSRVNLSIHNVMSQSVQTASWPGPIVVATRPSTRTRIPPPDSASED